MKTSNDSSAIGPDDLVDTVFGVMTKREHDAVCAQLIPEIEARLTSTENPVNYTCANCKNLKRTVIMGCPMYHCASTGFVVPQSGDSEKCTFTRVPEDCPRPETEVHKSGKTAAKRHWVTINHGKAAK